MTLKLLKMGHGTISTPLPDPIGQNPGIPVGIPFAWTSLEITQAMTTLHIK